MVTSFPSPNRAVRVKVHHSRRRSLRRHLQGWQSYTYKQRFARIAFLDRLHHFRQRELIAKVSLASFVILVVMF